MNKVIYLDNAATSFPKPESVAVECQRCINNYCVNAGRSSHRKSVYVNERIFSAREAIATLFGIANPERIAFTMNTTQALNTGLLGTLKKGDHLIISNMEHNSILRPANYLAKNGVFCSFAKADKNGEITFSAIKPLIRKNTKMVAMIHASNVTGRINNITEIGAELKKRNILFLVDAAQSAGVVPIDVNISSIDILCFPGHKGLLGPTGTGGIYVSENVKISPLMRGGTGSMSESREQPLQMPDLLESGTQNVLGISALLEGVKFVLGHKTEISESENFLADILADNLENIKGVTVLGRNGGKNTGIVGVKLSEKPPAEVSYLLDRDYYIATRAGFHCAPLAAKAFGAEKNGTLRFSVGFFNTRNDIDKASFALKKILSY